jgi:protease IV
VLICFSTGEAGQGSKEYYLASASDKVFIQPSGLIGLLGVAFQSYFFKDLFSKIGLKAQIFNYHEYKNAGNMFTESGYTDAHREQTQKITDSLFEQVMLDMLRSIPRDRLTTLFRRRPRSSPGSPSPAESRRNGFKRLLTKPRSTRTRR